MGKQLTMGRVATWCRVTYRRSVRPSIQLRLEQFSNTELGTQWTTTFISKCA